MCVCGVCVWSVSCNVCVWSVSCNVCVWSVSVSVCLIMCDGMFLLQRERDLELAARIGRSLLQRNELLEAELGSQQDNQQQLEQQV